MIKLSGIDGKDIEFLGFNILEQVKSAAEKDRAVAKKNGNYNAAVYFQGKIVACNEIQELLK